MTYEELLKENQKLKDGITNVKRDISILSQYEMQRFSEDSMYHRALNMTLELIDKYLGFIN